MSENFGGDIDSGLDSGGTAPKLSEKAQEKFQDRIAAANKAIKKIKAEEKKAKVFDDSLGAVIKQFLADGDKDYIISLIANLIEKNVPSDFILALILPISKIANEKVILKIGESGVSDLGLSVQLDSEFKQKIFDWINLIYSVAILEKEGILDSIIDHNTWKAIPGLDKLFLEVLKIILNSQGQEIGAFEEDLSKELFEKIIKKLETEIE